MAKITKKPHPNPSDKSLLLGIFSVEKLSEKKKKVCPTESLHPHFVQMQFVSQEIFLHVALRLSPHDISSLGQTCRNMHYSCSDSYLWSLLLRERFCIKASMESHSLRFYIQMHLRDLLFSKRVANPSVFSCVPVFSFAYPLPMKRGLDGTYTLMPIGTLKYSRNVEMWDSVEFCIYTLSYLDGRTSEILNNESCLTAKGLSTSSFLPLSQLLVQQLVKYEMAVAY